MEPHKSTALIVPSKLARIETSSAVLFAKVPLVLLNPVDPFFHVHHMTVSSSGYLRTTTNAVGVGTLSW